MKHSCSEAFWMPISCLLFFNILRSEMSHDRPNTFLAGQHHRPLSKNYYEPWDLDWLSIFDTRTCMLTNNVDVEK